MQNFSQRPIFSDVADWFAYPALVAGNTKTITIATANGTAKAYITLQPEHYFMFCGFAAQTNYDNFGGVFRSANANATIGQPSVPNAFTVEIQRASSNSYSNQQLTQSEVCSSGMLSGKQNPIPVIYGPAVTVNFKFSDLTGLLRLTQEDTAVSLTIQFWMIGYSIPVDEWGRFLRYFPALEQEFNSPAGRWTGASRIISR